MTDRHDLQLVLRSGVPIVVIETTDEGRFLQLLTDIALAAPAASYRPLFRWSVTDGLQRLDLDLEPQRHNSEPTEVLRHIRAVKTPAIYALLDLHPFLADPVNTRLLKDISINGQHTKSVVLLISHRVQLPPELEGFSARFELRLPDDNARLAIIEHLVENYREEHPGRKVEIDPKAMRLLVQNLSGLSYPDTERLARNAIQHDGAISVNDIPNVMKAKYELLNRGGVLSYEHDTAGFEDVAGFSNVKLWLRQRTSAFSGGPPPGLDTPKGILLIGVQGCGKSLAAKAAASLFGVPLLRLEFGALYDKYHGETERKLRESLKTAEVMGPCVLWLDEIEKGLATGTGDSGTSQRVLGSLLTWMAERRSRVLLVATANDIEALPPELIRKGRFDETFFVDLPTGPHRAEILTIHFRKRGLNTANIDLDALIGASESFSGAEIEQAVVAAIYAAHAGNREPGPAHVLAELRKTRPLAVLMRERIADLRAWAADRTVPADAAAVLGIFAGRTAAHEWSILAFFAGPFL
jgi:AAA+ superfamily predicted ATPase